MITIIKYTLDSLLLITMFSCTEHDNSNVGQDLTIEDHKLSSLQSESNTLTTSFEDAYKVVDEMPLFGGCKDKPCSDKELINYIHKNVLYPQEAKDASIEGRMYVRFVIEVDGSVSNIETVRSLGKGTSESVVNVVRGFNDLDQGWSAGVQDGNKVPVLFTLPVSFKLES